MVKALKGINTIGVLQCDEKKEENGSIFYCTGDWNQVSNTSMQYPKLLLRPFVTDIFLIFIGATLN